MDTNKNKIFLKLDGKIEKTSEENIIKLLPKKMLFTGSIEYKEVKTMYVFNSVDKHMLKHILNEIKNDVGLSEVKIEIQTHDGDAKAIQRKSIKRYLI